MYPHNAMWIHNSHTSHTNGQDHTLTLRDVKLTRCSAKTQLLCNGDECNEVTEIWALIHNALTWLLYSAGRKMHAETRNKEVVKTNWNATTLDSLGLCTHSE